MFNRKPGKGATTKDILIAARKKIDNGWTKGNYARNIFNIRVAPESFFAVKWCAIGAVFAVADTDNYLSALTDKDNYTDNYLSALRVLRRANYEVFQADSLAWWQDQPERTKEEILALYDYAIMECERLEHLA
jgi:hypothetical protein